VDDSLIHTATAWAWRGVKLFGWLALVFVVGVVLFRLGGREIPAGVCLLLSVVLVGGAYRLVEPWLRRMAHGR
jgi:hypothetical protein